jgi:uncharacterized protein with HEPN domain
MSPRKWQNRIQDILDAIAETRTFVDGYTYERFRQDTKTIKAVGANLVIIGEAASHIPEDIQSSTPAVPWHLMRAMRNRVVHIYFDIDPAILWDIVQQDLPGLIQPLQKLIK